MRRLRILLTGASGQLGREIARQAALPLFEIQALGHGDLDIARGEEVNDRIGRIEPDLVVNAAAYTNVDQAEAEPAKALSVNRDGPANLAKTCARVGIPLIHISTDYVFDGSQKTPYRESDPICPLNMYGKSKAEGENRVRSALDRHLILRTSWLYGVDGSNFVKTILRLAGEKEELEVVSDQHGSPTAAADLAEAVLSICRRMAEGLPVSWGTYHYCGEGIVTWFEFAEEIVDAARGVFPLRVQRIRPVTTAQYPTRARRPPFSVLDCRRIREDFGIELRPWKESLRETIGRMVEEKKRIPSPLTGRGSG